MDVLTFLPFLAVCTLAALTGAFFRPGEWYERLPKPAWTPPDWLFGPVWSVLYLMIAVSGWLVWREAGFAQGSVALAAYGLQLLANAGWSAVFFGLKTVGLALAEIVLLWLSIVVTILLFAPISLWAALLLVPYLLWVSFAAALNFAIWRRVSASGTAEAS